MRFVIAILLFVVALVTIGLGIAQRTILAGPGEFSTSVTTGSAPITVVDGGALNALPGTQGVTITGPGEIFLAYGRTTDVLAWVGDLSYNHVTFDPKTPDRLVTKTVPGGGTSGVGETAVPTAPPADATPTPGATDTPAVPELVSFSGEVPDPRGSDLWVQEFAGNDELIRKINAPEDISLIIMSNGIDSAPTQLSFDWPLDNSTPLSGPLIIAGILSMLAGLAAFLWALVHTRRRRGPRRKQPRLPRAPQPKRLKRAPQRKQLPAGPTRMVAASGILIATLALTGCSVGAGVLGSGLDPVPTPASTDIVDANNLKPTAVTKQQLQRIIDKTAETIDKADTDKDATLAATRLEGPALVVRTANYKITKKASSLAAVSPFPGGELGPVLPQQNDSWPRSVFAVVYPDDTNAAPVAVMLVQETPRDNYKVHYMMTFEPGVELPKVAPAAIGSVSLKPDNQFGPLAPQDLAAAYGEVLILGDTAPEFATFDAESDTLRVDIGAEAKAARKKKLPSQAKIEFTNAANPEPPISFPTNDGGQIVAVALDDTETVTPVEAGAAINSEGAVKALSGLARSARGFIATYGVQLLFYVPSSTAGDTAKIQLLGFTSALTSAKEVSK